MTSGIRPYGGNYGPNKKQQTKILHVSFFFNVLAKAAASVFMSNSASQQEKCIPTTTTTTTSSPSKITDRIVLVCCVYKNSLTDHGLPILAITMKSI